MKITPRIRLHGDKVNALTLIPYSLIELEFLKTLMGFQDLKQDIKRIHLDENPYPVGRTVTVRWIFDHPTIDIYVPFIGPPVVIEEEELIPYPFKWAVFLFNNAYVYISRRVDGDPKEFGYAFNDIIYTGILADDVHFVKNLYWKVINGEVYKGRVDSRALKVGTEVRCYGIPATIQSLTVAEEEGSGLYYAWVELDEDPSDPFTDADVYRYESDDGITWRSGTVYEDDDSCVLNQRLVMDNEESPGGNSGYWQDDEHYALEDMENEVRLLRIGVREGGRWGDLVVEAWTSTRRDQQANVFTYENPFTMETGITGMQILQIIEGNWWEHDQVATAY